MGVRWVGVVAACVGLVAAKPIESVLNEQGGRVTLVSPESPAALAALASSFRGVECRYVAPADFAALKWPQKGDRAVFFLYSRDQTAAWPEAALAALPKPVAAVPANQVLACYKHTKGGNYQFELIAPDYAGLNDLLGELLGLDALRCDTHPDNLINYELSRALAVGSEPELLRAWLVARQDATFRYEIQTVAPAALKAEHLAAGDPLVAALTVEEWVGLDPAARQQLAARFGPKLPWPADRPDTTAAVTATDLTGGHGVLIVAPTPRFASYLLGSVEVSGALRDLVIADWEAGGGACRLRDLRTVRRVAMAAVAAGLPTPAVPHLVEALRSALSSRCGWRFVDEQLDPALRQRLSERLARGEAPTGPDELVEAVWVPRLTAVSSRTEYRQGVSQCVTVLPEAPPPFTEHRPDWRRRCFCTLHPRYEGPDDPSYLQALRDWLERKDAAYRRETEHVAALAAMPVAWDVSEVRTQRVNVSGELYLCDRQGTRLMELPLDGQYELTDTRVERQVVRGAHTRPAPLRLPAPRDEAAIEVARGALDKAVDGAVQALRMAALLPCDSGSAASESSAVR